MVDFAEIAGIITDVLQSEGVSQAVTLTEPPTGGTYDEATDTTTGASPGDAHQGTGVEGKYSAFSIANGLAAKGDVKFTLMGLKTDGSAMPQPVADSWTLTYQGDGSVWTIKSVDRTRPNGGTKIVFVLQLGGPG
jgi:hypothetical protein